MSFNINLYLFQEENERLKKSMQSGGVMSGSSGMSAEGEHITLCSLFMVTNYVTILTLYYVLSSSNIFIHKID